MVSSSVHDFIVGRQHQHSPPDMVDIDMTTTTGQSERTAHTFGHDAEIQGYDPKRQRDHRRRTMLYVFVLGMGWVAAIALAITLRVENSKNRNENLNPPTTDPNDDDMGFVIRINCGATEPYTDTVNNVWLADTNEFDGEDGFSVSGRGHTYDAWSIRNEESINTTTSNTTSSAASITIANAGPEGMGLYVNERYFIVSGWYEIPVPNDGVYEVVLYFSENYYTEQYQRVFDIFVERELVAKDYDILRATGGQNHTATWVSHSAFVTDGSVSIQLISRLEHAKISGILVRDFRGEQ